mmetsp:Transcript_10459/g.15841  ORF Transcript_10459/g.15841 Transcript_10459/m.15841 type:complete len:89 (-) Transcript_10459:879-1145(-)
MRTSQFRSAFKQFYRSRPSTASNRARTRTLESRRTIGHNERNSCIFQSTRTAIAVEASSLRYVHYLKSQSEDTLPRGWDDMEEDEDGT